MGVTPSQKTFEKNYVNVVSKRKFDEIKWVCDKSR